MVRSVGLYIEKNPGFAVVSIDGVVQAFLNPGEVAGYKDVWARSSPRARYSVVARPAPGMASAIDSLVTSHIMPSIWDRDDNLLKAIKETTKSTAAEVDGNRLTRGNHALVYDGRALLQEIVLAKGATVEGLDAKYDMFAVLSDLDILYAKGPPRREEVTILFPEDRAEGSEGPTLVANNVGVELMTGLRALAERHKFSHVEAVRTA